MNSSYFPRARYSSFYQGINIPPPPILQMGKLRPIIQMIYLPQSYRETAARVRLDPRSPDLHYLWKHPVTFHNSGGQRALPLIEQKLVYPSH